jgi:predicted ATP-grasp superfamily ATP-dependent carboligase
MKCSRELHPYRERLNQTTRVLLPDSASFRIADDNRLTLEECGKLGIPAPCVYEFDEAARILEENAASKLIVKPRKDFGGARGVHVAGSSAALKTHVEEVERQFGEAVVQEYIPGSPQAMRSMNLLFDRSGKLQAAFTYRKIRQWPPTGGLSAHFASVQEPEVLATMSPFFEKWKWQGPVELEYKWDSRDNKPKLIEINPRYSGNIAFALTCGVPFARLHCMVALGQQVPDGSLYEYRDDIKGLWFYYYLKSLLKEFKHSRHRSKLLASELEALRGTRFELLSNLSDIGPIIGFVLRLLNDRNMRD